MADDKNKKFSVSVHLTSKKIGDQIPQNSNISSFWKEGRPDLVSEIGKLSYLKNNLLVFVCGPNSMVEECSELTMKYGVQFRHETFEL